MKICVKTLKGTNFEIEVEPEDTVADVKKNIETVQGPDVYPAARLMIIFQGNILKDSTTLNENNVRQNGYIVIMLSKVPQTNRSAPASNLVSNTARAPLASLARPAPAPTPTPTSAPASTVPEVSESNIYNQTASELIEGLVSNEAVHQILNMGGGTWDRETVIRALAAAHNNPKRAIEYLYFGIPEPVEATPVPRSPFIANPPVQAPPAPVPSSEPNANPLDLFPQDVSNMGSNAADASGILNFLRNNQEFQDMRAIVQANPQLLQTMLQEMGKRGSCLSRLIQEHRTDFLSLINEPVEGGEGSPRGRLHSNPRGQVHSNPRGQVHSNPRGQVQSIPRGQVQSNPRGQVQSNPRGQVQSNPRGQVHRNPRGQVHSNPQGQHAATMPQTISVTREEYDAIERLRAMGFDSDTVVEAFFVCNKNEELAANYLLDHVDDEE